jgi:hypothetical protein
MENKCQIYTLEGLAQPLSITEVLWQRRNRLKRILKRRWNYLTNFFSATIETRKKASPVLKEDSAGARLNPGDKVRVKSKAEIQATLNHWNQLKKCSFMEEMWPYCDSTQQVFKRVEIFLDERDYLMKKCKNIIILKDVFCEGTKDFGKCDRSCFFFWREEWLEKI